MTDRYGTDFANATLSSRVLVSPRRYRALVPVGRPYQDDQPARFVLISPSGHNVAVKSDGAVTLYTALQQRTLVFSDTPGVGAAIDGGFITKNLYYEWDEGEALRMELFMEPGAERHLALQCEGRVWTAVTESVPAHNSPFLNVMRARFGSDDVASVGGWRGAQQGRGLGAIASDGRIGLIVGMKEFVLYDRVGKDGEGVVLTQKTLPFPDASQPFVWSLAYAVSAVNERFAVLSARITDNQYDVPGSLTVGGSYRSRWETLLMMVDASGNVPWQLSLPFEALQPAIDVGGDRVALAGRGLAVVSEGKVSWSQPSEHSLRVTAFKDGELAVVAGTQLNILAADGVVLQSLTTPNGDVLTSFPGVAPDGTVYVASGTQLYRTE